MATGENMALYVAAYDEAGVATTDFEALKDAQANGDLKVIGAVVLERADDGAVDVKEHHTGLVGGGATAGGIIGLVVGLFAPPVLLSTAVGAAIGGGIGALSKRHEEKELGVELEEYLPPGTSAIVTVVEDEYLDRVDHALSKSAKKVSKAIDSDDYDKLTKELSKAGYRIEDAIES